MPATLLVLARGTAMVPDFAAIERPNPLRRFLGRTYRQVAPGQWGFEPKAEAEAVEASADVIKALRDGDLWPADKATADAAGVEFDPKFGGEYAAKKQPAKGNDQPGETGGKGDS